MQTLIEKAAVLVEALPYIQRFRGEIAVVKFGGSAMEEKAGVEAILRDVAFMACVGLHPVIVHGGGKAISKEMKEAGLKANFVKGLRVTDDVSITVVEQVLNRSVNPALVQALGAMGCKARGLYGEDIMTATKHTEEDPETGEMLEWGHVGDVESVDIEPILAYSKGHIVPVITPLGRGKDGKLYNINADDAAAAVAVALKARKIVFMSDVPGLLREPKDPSSLISTLHTKDVAELIDRKVIDGGMIPKVQGAVRALEAGVKKAHFVHAGMTHSLLLELFTDKGVGTEIIH